MCKFCCPYCEDFFEKESDFSTHVFVTHFENNGKSFCAKCHCQLTEFVEEHVRKEHESECVVCGYHIKKEDRSYAGDFMHEKCWMLISTWDQTILKRIFKCFGKEMPTSFELLPGLIFYLTENVDPQFKEEMDQVVSKLNLNLPPMGKF